MAMTNRNNTKLDSFIMYTMNELVPQDHLVRKLENALDFRFIYPKVKPVSYTHLDVYKRQSFSKALLSSCFPSRCSTRARRY